MMKPTIGRVVYYKDSTGAHQSAAIIAHVWNDECVNLMVIDRNGNSSGKTSVTRGAGAYQWDWMPYQKAKAEAEAGDHNSESAEPRPESDCERVSR